MLQRKLTQYRLLDRYYTGDTDLLCLAPISINVEPRVSPGTSVRERIRCGQCRHCRIRKKAAWTGRLLLELASHQGVGRFITLTYKTDPGHLNYSHFQLFMKRYRKAKGPCRFFAVGEYGELGDRGHWHAIIFGHLQEAIGFLELPSWGHGFAFDGSATRSSLGYVSGYMLKKEVDNQEHIIRASNRPGIGFKAICEFATNAAKHYNTEAPDSWPGAFTYADKRYPLTDGALQKFKAVYTKEGGLPPPEDDPEERHLANLLHSQGDDFFQEREARNRWAVLERERIDGPQAKRFARL